MKKSFGFTMIEVLIAVAIIGLLTVIIIPNINQARLQNITKQSQNEFYTIITGLEEFRQRCGHYPEQVFLTSTGDASNCNNKSIRATTLVPGGQIRHITVLRYSGLANSANPNKCIGYKIGYSIANNSRMNILEGDENVVINQLAPGTVKCGSSMDIFAGTEQGLFDVTRPRSLVVQ